MAKKTWTWDDYQRQHGDQSDKPGAVAVTVQPEPAAPPKLTRGRKKATSPPAAILAETELTVPVHDAPTAIKIPKPRRTGKRQSGGWREDLPNPNDVDRAVGHRIRELRVLRGMSQSALGAAVGLTFQQVQKYERGGNRIGAGRLLQIAEILDVPVSALFDQAPRKAGDVVTVAPVASRRVMDATRYLNLIDDNAAQSILDLVRTMAKQAGVEVGEVE